MRHAARDLANAADNALLKAFKLAHAVFCYRRNLFYLARKPAELAIKPKSLAGEANSFARKAKRLARNGIKLAHKVIYYRRKAFRITRQITKPGGEAFRFESERTGLSRIAQCEWREASRPERGENPYLPRKIVPGTNQSPWN